VALRRDTRWRAHAVTWHRGLVTLAALAALTGCAATQADRPPPVSPPAATAATATSVATPNAEPVAEVTEYEDLAYGPAVPGNLLDLYVPDAPGDAELPLLIWHTGSGWGLNDVKAVGEEVPVVEEFTARGYAVASINIRSSLDARFPAQGFDVRAAIRYLRENAATYGIDPDRFAFMGNSSGGWATAFAAMTGNTLELDGEAGVDGTSSAVQVAVAFFPPTDFLSLDEFIAANDLQMDPEIYPADSPTSLVSLLIQCPGEGPSEGPPDPAARVSIQECPAETEKADPASYIDGAEVPIWLLHGLADTQIPYNQSQLVYDATIAEGNQARLTLVRGAEHRVEDIIDAEEATTWVTDTAGEETETVGAGPSWDEIADFIRATLEQAR
jgi:acetyl esterase/lipase